MPQLFNLLMPMGNLTLYETYPRDQFQDVLFICVVVSVALRWDEDA